MAFAFAIILFSAIRILISSACTSVYNIQYKGLHAGGLWQRHVVTLGHWGTPHPQLQTITFSVHIEAAQNLTVGSVFQSNQLKTRLYNACTLAHVLRV